MSIRGAEAGATGSEAKERRAAGAQRVHFEALVAVGETEGGGFEAESVDVSADGMRLRTAYLPDVGDKLVCRFDGMGSELVVEGEVVWRNEAQKGGEFGLRFMDLDQATMDALRGMCDDLGGGDEPSAEPASVPRGARVRLHIEGLGSPMKARVREAATREIEVGSNLEFLKVGRPIELEDVDQGVRREATIDHVKVDIDPASSVPQLVVTLRYEGGADDKKAPLDAKKASADKGEKPESKPEKKKALEPKSSAVAASREAKKAEPSEAQEAELGEGDESDVNGLGAKAKAAGNKIAGSVGPALAGLGARARGAMGAIAAMIQKKREASAEAKKSSAPKRTTAPPPGGALRADGKRLVRDDEEGGGDEMEAPRSNKRAAIIGGVLGLIAVIALYSVTRVMTKSAPVADQKANVPALEGAAQPSGTPVANMPYFGPTPMSTTELVPPGPSPSGSAMAAAPGASGAPNAAPPAGDNDDEPGPSAGANAANDAKGPPLKEWGQGTVTKPVTLKIKMDGPIERITGASGAAGFTISVPGKRSLSTGTDFTKKDKRLSSVKVVNSSNGAEITVQFKGDVPAYLAKIKGDKLEIALGRDGHAKVAKAGKKGGKKKKGKKHSDD